jgi:hypothetical protein
MCARVSASEYADDVEEEPWPEGRRSKVSLRRWGWRDSDRVGTGEGYTFASADCCHATGGRTLLRAALFDEQRLRQSEIEHAF